MPNTIASTIVMAALFAGSMPGPSCLPCRGYTDQLGRWVPGYITNSTWFMPYPQHSAGKAAWYGPGVMRATTRWRGLSLDGYLDGVALMSCHHIGDTVWLKRHDQPGLPWEGPFLVADCPRRGDTYSAVVFTGEVVEVGWTTAVRWGLARWVGGDRRYAVKAWSVPVSVWIGERPPPAPPRTPSAYRFRGYWLDRAEFANRWERRPIFVPPDDWIWPEVETSPRPLPRLPRAVRIPS